MAETKNENENFGSTYFSKKTEGAKLAEATYGGLSGLSQALSLEKITGGKGVSQSIGLVNAKDSNLLMAVTRGGKTVAEFRRVSVSENGQSKDKVELTLSPEFVAEMKKANPDLKLEEKAVLEKVFFNQTGGIETAEAGGANSDVAIMLSALGAQVKDKDGRISRKSTRAGTSILPYDVVITDKGYDAFLSQEMGMSTDRKEPLYTNMLVQRLQLKRLNSPNKNQAVKLELTVSREIAGTKRVSKKPVELHSVPVKNGESVNYLNMIKENGRDYVYLHTTKTDGKTKAYAQKYEISDMGFERDENQQNYLVIGLKTLGGDVRYVSTKIDSTELESTMKYLSTNFATPMQKKEDLAADHVVGTESGKNSYFGFHIFNTPARATADILSFDELSQILLHEKAPKTNEPVQLTTEKKKTSPTGNPQNPPRAAAAKPEKTEVKKESPIHDAKWWSQVIRTDKIYNSRAETYARMMGKSFDKSASDYEDKLAAYYADKMVQYEKKENPDVVKAVNLAEDVDRYDTELGSRTFASYSKEKKQAFIQRLNDVGATPEFVFDFAQRHAPELITEEEIQPEPEKVSQTPEKEVKGTVVGAKEAAEAHDHWFNLVKTNKNYQQIAEIYTELFVAPKDRLKKDAPDYTDKLAEFLAGEMQHAYETGNYDSYNLAEDVFHIQTLGSNTWTYEPVNPFTTKEDKAEFIQKLQATYASQEFVFDFAEKYAPELIEVENLEAETEVVPTEAAEPEVADVPKEAEFANEEFADTKLKATVAGRALKEIDYQGMKGKSQELSLSKIGGGKGVFQSVSIVAGETQPELILAVTRGTDEDKKEIARFEHIMVADNGEFQDKVELTLSAEFVAEMKKTNPDISLEDGENHIVLEKVVFSQTKGIETAQVGGANRDVAIVLSALGARITDKNNNVASRSTKIGDKIVPYDFVMTDRGYDAFLNQQYGMNTDRKEPLYSNMLIQRLEVERMKNPEMAAQPLKLALPSTKDVERDGLVEKVPGTIELHSLPLSVKNGDTTEQRNLNMIKEDGKEYVYLHTTSGNGAKKNNQTTAERFEILDIGIERNNDNENFLVIGLKKGRESRYVLVNVAEDSLESTMQYLSENFPDSLHNRETKTGADATYFMQKDEDGNEKPAMVGKYHVFNNNTRTAAQILSFDELSNILVKEDSPEKSRAIDDVITEPDAKGKNAGSEDKGTGKDDKSGVVDGTNNGGTNGDPTNDDDKDADKKGEDKKPEDKKPEEEKKKEKEKKKLLKPTKRNMGLVIGLGILAAVAIMISTIIPGMQPIGIALGLGAITTFAQPWNLVVHGVNARRTFYNWKLDREKVKSIVREAKIEKLATKEQIKAEKKAAKKEAKKLAKQEKRNKKNPEVETAGAAVTPKENVVTDDAPVNDAVSPVIDGAPIVDEVVPEATIEETAATQAEQSRTIEQTEEKQPAEQKNNEWNGNALRTVATAKPLYHDEHAKRTSRYERGIHKNDLENMPDDLVRLHEVDPEAYDKMLKKIVAGKGKYAEMREDVLPETIKAEIAAERAAQERARQEAERSYAAAQSNEIKAPEAPVVEPVVEEKSDAKATATKKQPGEKSQVVSETVAENATAKGSKNKGQQKTEQAVDEDRLKKEIADKEAADKTLAEQRRKEEAEAARIAEEKAKAARIAEEEKKRQKKSSSSSKKGKGSSAMEEVSENELNDILGDSTQKTGYDFSNLPSSTGNSLYSDKRNGRGGK